jgi:hypothetical protein
MMTTATDKDTSGKPIRNDSGSAADPFGYGAGLVQPKYGMDPGLVYDSTYTDWTKFVCGSGQVPSTHELCANGKIDLSDLNYPTIAIGDLAGKQTVTRTVTNVGKVPEVYFPKVEGVKGLKVTVSPKLLVTFPGRSTTYKVTIENNGAPLEQYSFGKLVWKSANHSVASTLAIKPLTVRAPVQVNGSGTEGSVDVPITSGYAGTLNTTALGLNAATVADATLKNPGGLSFPTTAPKANDHVAKFTANVPVGSTYARFSTFDADYPAGTDLDVFVYQAGTTTLLGSSTGGSAEEEVNLSQPVGGPVDVYVDLYAGANAQQVKLNHWELQKGAGSLTVTPASQPVQVAGQAAVTASWTGLNAGTRYLGQLHYTDGADGAANTLIRIDS